MYVCVCVCLRARMLLRVVECVCEVLILMNEGAVDDSWEKGSIRGRVGFVCFFV